jgi:hypothetical protein
MQVLPALKVNIIIVDPRGIVFPKALVQAIIALIYRNSIYNNVGCNRHLFVCFYLVFS